MYPNPNPNNFGSPYGYRSRPNVPNQPDINDPNLLNNPALFQYIQQMNVQNQPMPGFSPWNASQEGYGFAGVTPQNTPGGHFDRQRVIDTPPRTPHSPDVEVVEETQPVVEARKRRHRRKPTDEPRMKTTAIPWKKEEEMCLCKAWLEVTEDPKEANYQKERTYWSRITKIFLRLMGEEEGYRDPDGVSAKWRKIRPQIQHFNEIYTRLRNANNHQSGSNDADVVKKAFSEYKGTYGKTFGYVDIWDKLRFSSKFHYVTDSNDARKSRGEPTKKRTKTSSSGDYQSQGSDARVNFDLNSVDEDEEVEFRERPVGRDMSRKSSSSVGGSSSKGKGKLDNALDDISGQLRGLMDLTAKRLEYGDRKLKAKESKIKLAELRVLSTDYSDLPEPERSIMEKAKQDLIEKYRDA